MNSVTRRDTTSSSAPLFALEEPRAPKLAQNRQYTNGVDGEKNQTCTATSRYCCSGSSTKSGLACRNLLVRLEAPRKMRQTLNAYPLPCIRRSCRDASSGLLKTRLRVPLVSGRRCSESSTGDWAYSRDPQALSSLTAIPPRTR
jgi:hypothetical protein